MPNLAELSVKHFAPLTGATFSLSLPQTSVELALEEVKPLGGGLRTGGGFSLLWNGPLDPEISQGTYRIAHEAIGEHGIFIVPIARTESHMVYEAIFN